MDQPNSWRQVPMVVLPKLGGVDNFEEHSYLSLLATLSKWMMRVLVERMRQHPRPDVHRRFHTVGATQSWQTSTVIRPKLYRRLQLFLLIRIS